MAVKEILELVRQPQLLLLLLVGPILIVVEPGSEGATLFERFRDVEG